MFAKKYHKYKDKFLESKYGGAEWGAPRTKSTNIGNPRNLIRAHVSPDRHTQGTHFGSHTELRGIVDSDVHIHPLTENRGGHDYFRGYSIKKK